MRMKPLDGKICLVTGASRGIGKGIALGLGEAGATVYITGRTVEPGKAAVALPGTIHETAAEVNAAGGKCTAIQCDHTKDDETRAVFDRIFAEQGKLDLLVNNIWGGYEFFNDGTQFWLEKGFWTTPISRWDLSFNSGVRAHYVASVFAAAKMVEQKSGLIVNISSLAGQKTTDGIAYCSAKAADDRMAACMAHELRPHNVAALSLYPGLVRTEAVLKAKDYFDLSNSESPQFIGRVVAGLMDDPKLMEKSGTWHIAAELAQQYGIGDIDGKQPKSLRDTVSTKPSS
jgi:NAD(P)-dependent dehydrogenase (short-subunit alcohol dehydrogenase family)